MQFVYTLGAPRVISARGSLHHVSQFEVQNTLDKPQGKKFLAVLADLGPTPLWKADDYDTQLAGAGFTQGAIEARLDELFPAV